MVNRVRLQWIFAFLSLLAGVQSGAAAQSDDSSDAEITRWIQLLGDDRFANREWASHQLLRSGSRAIELVEQALESADQDKADRLVRFLAELALDVRSDAGSLAIQSLRRLAAERVTVPAMLADRALGSIGEHQRYVSERELVQLGAESGFTNIQVLTDLRRDCYVLRMKSNFRGTALDLEHLQWLYGIEHLSIDGPQIDGKWLKQIAKMPSLRILQIRHASLRAEDLAWLEDLPQLETLEILYTDADDRWIDAISRLPVSSNMRLFGTKITPYGLAEIKGRMSDIDIIFGKGGYLGVGMFDAQSSMIGSIRAGGAANLAGLQAYDRIVSINEKPISKFEDLRRELGHYSANEKVEVVYERRDRTTNEWIRSTVTVTLGEQE